jgi:hypothetical protein
MGEVVIHHQNEDRDQTSSNQSHGTIPSACSRFPEREAFSASSPAAGILQKRARQDRVAQYEHIAAQAARICRNLFKEWLRQLPKAGGIAKFSGRNGSGQRDDRRFIEGAWRAGPET